MRIGGDKSRVSRFLVRYPWAAKPVTGTATPEPKQAEKPVTAPAPAPEPKPEPEQRRPQQARPSDKPGSGIADVLASWGVR